MESKNTMRENYHKDSFYLAQIICNSLKRRGYHVPVLEMEKELKKERAKNYINKRRRKQYLHYYGRKPNR